MMITDDPEPDPEPDPDCEPETREAVCSQAGEGPAGFIIRTTQVTVGKRGAPVFDHGATTVAIVDDGAGEYLRIGQPGRDGGGDHIFVEADEWPALCRAVDYLFTRMAALP